MLTGRSTTRVRFNQRKNILLPCFKDMDSKANDKDQDDATTSVVVEMSEMSKKKADVPESESSPRTKEKSFASLAVVYLSVAIDMLGVSIILPVLPQLALSFDVGSAELGYIFAAYGAAQMISMPLFGKVSDRVRAIERGILISIFLTLARARETDWPSTCCLDFSCGINDRILFAGSIGVVHVVHVVQGRRGTVRIHHSRCASLHRRLHDGRRATKVSRRNV